MDVVELAPTLDPTKSTGNLCATLMCEFMAGRAKRQLDGNA
jgi:arginase family enzyme